MIKSIWNNLYKVGIIITKTNILFMKKITIWDDHHGPTYFAKTRIQQPLHHNWRRCLCWVIPETIIINCDQNCQICNYWPIEYKGVILNLLWSRTFHKHVTHYFSGILPASILIVLWFQTFILADPGRRHRCPLPPMGPFFHFHTFPLKSTHIGGGRPPPSGSAPSITESPIQPN